MFLSFDMGQKGISRVFGTQSRDNAAGGALFFTNAGGGALGLFFFVSENSAIAIYFAISYDPGSVPTI